MIDNLLKFADEAEAKADPVVGTYWRADGQGGGSWDAARCMPGELVWQPSTDTTETVTTPDGRTLSVAVHHPITDADGRPYWYILIALPDLDGALLSHPGMVLIADRDKANTGETFVIASPLPVDALSAYMLEPQPAGANYPFGAPQ